MRRLWRRPWHQNHLFGAFIIINKLIVRLVGRLDASHAGLARGQLREMRHLSAGKDLGATLRALAYLTVLFSFFCWGRPGAEKRVRRIVYGEDQSAGGLAPRLG
ncbi:hypothetical protein LX32DRAFT_387053 [Colletotrichum zoysiae]|uniref:Uncharacterized protein n=1 Tax=Colletotrichum zoysiae TaxID=1216348 RepID=A0AAD9HGN2_9PEZI|nr:hypothetical protein LX32DRAFT_387053 [Colletotrichum zoysiae]